jgi:hypothetical protein
MRTPISYFPCSKTYPNENHNFHSRASISEALTCSRFLRLLNKDCPLTSFDSASTLTNTLNTALHDSILLNFLF